MAVGGVFGGFNVRAELRIWGAPHQGAGGEQEAGQGLAEATLGRVFDLLDICDEQTWGMSSPVHIL